MASCSVPYVVHAIIWAELSIRRTSLNEGETKRRDEMYLLWSWTLNPASRGSRVKKGPTPGMSSWSFDGRGLFSSF